MSPPEHVVQRMRASIDGLASLHHVRARLLEITEHAGLDRSARERAVHAVHEASVLACSMVDDAEPLGAPRDVGPDDLCCTLDAVATEWHVRAEIVLPPRVRLDPARRGDDALRFVLVFGDEASWSVGPGHRGLVVVVHSEALATTS